MDRTRKSLLILGAITLVEAVPLAMTVAGARPGAFARLWGWQGGGAAWLAAAAVTLAYVVHGARSLPLVRERFFEVSALKLTAIPFALVTGAFEELFFRKMLMDAAAHQGAGAAMQVALSAAVFGLGHALWGLFGRSWRVALGAAVATGLLGGLLAGVYLLAGRQLAPCIWAHTLVNLALEPWMVLAAVSAGEKGWAGRGAR